MWLSMQPAKSICEHEYLLGMPPIEKNPVVEILPPSWGLRRSHNNDQFAFIIFSTFYHMRCQKHCKRLTKMTTYHCLLQKFESSWLAATSSTNVVAWHLNCRQQIQRPCRDCEPDWASSRFTVYTWIATNLPNYQFYISVLTIKVPVKNVGVCFNFNTNFDAVSKLWPES